MQTPYYTNTNGRLYEGNCIDIMNQMPEKSVDMIFADPPYMLSNGGISVQNGKMVSVNKGKWDKSKGVESDMLFHTEWLVACKRVLQDNGTLWVSGTYHSIYQCGYALQKLGYHILNDIIWYKPNASPNLSCRVFTASHETLLWSRKSKDARHYFDYESMKNGVFTGDIIKNKDTQMRSVWCIATTKPSEKMYGKHPTQKPLALLERIIKASTKEGDIVLDPFAGSSTTGVAALSQGRKYIGIEMEKEYLELSIKRLESVYHNLL